MSVHVSSWVLRNSEERLGRRLVLLALADHANEDGTGAYPAVMTLAHEARLSRSQVQRCLHDLVAAGSIVDKGTSRFGTTIYDVVMEGGSQIATGRKSDVSTPQNAARTVLSTTIQKTSLPKTNGKASRDRIWDTLTDIFGPVTLRSAETLRGRQVAELAAAGATPDEIVKRAKSWPLHFDSATLTAPALVKHWDTLGRRPLRRR